MKHFLLALSIVLVGCTHSIHVSHMSDVNSNTPDSKNVEKHIIESRGEQTVVLGFVFDTDYVNEAYQGLLDQCQGAISAVNTQYSTSHGFLHWTNKIRMKAVCRSQG